VTHSPDTMAHVHRKRRRGARSRDSSLLEFAHKDTDIRDFTNTRLSSNDDIRELSPGGFTENVEERVDGRRTKNFEKRARHKMKDVPTKSPKKNTSKKDQSPKKAASRKRKKGEVSARNKSDALIEGFSAENIKSGRITVRVSPFRGT
jgi:hypothetical protein